MRKILCLLIAFMLGFSFCAYAENVEETEIIDNIEQNEDKTQDEDDSAEDDTVIEKEYEWSADLSVVDGEFENVQSYTLDESEKEIMYDAETVLRRDGVSGEAFIIYEIPYIHEMYAVSYHLASDVAQFSFELSKDGVEWTSIETESVETTEPDKWTKIEYTVDEIEEMRFVKVIWGEEENNANWWNPYFGGILANCGESVPTEAVILSDVVLQIPMYDEITYTLEAEVRDQIGLAVDAEIKWLCEDELVTVSENGEVTIMSDMEDGYEFTVCITDEVNELEAEKTFSLVAPMPGDSDGDNIITDADIESLIECFGEETSADNRLCDVDKNGVVDIIDLAYLTKYISIEK